MKRQNTLIPLLNLFLVLLVSNTCLAEEVPSLASYLEQALTGNDSLQSARAEFRAGTERVRQVGVLPDPKLSVQYYLEPVETRTGPQEGAISISQTVPWFNKLSLSRKMMDTEATIVGAKLAATELDVARQVKEAYIEYGFLGRSLQTVSDNLELLRYLEGVARSRYAGSKTTYFDVLKIQIELAKTEEKSKSLADQAGPLRVHINSLLGSESERARAIPASLPLVELKRGEDEIITLALEGSPLLHQAQQRIAKARTGRKLAEQDFYPDFTFSLKTIFTGSAEFGNPPDSGQDPIIAGVKFNLPIFRDRRNGKIAEKEAIIAAAQSFQHLQELTLAAKIERSLYRYREAQRKISLYREDLLPKVKQQLEVAINGFQSGQSSILELIDAEKSLLTFQLAKSRAMADQAVAIARLEARAGVTLADWE